MGELEAYKELGVAGLFIVMYLSTVWFLLRTLKAQAEKAEKNTERMISVVEANNAGNREHAMTNRELKSAVEKFTDQSQEVLAYMKGRDDAAKGKVSDA